MPGAVFVALWACYTWIRSRQLRLFLRELRPRIAASIEERDIAIHGLIAGMRQHAELRTLLDLFIAGAERRLKT